MRIDVDHPFPGAQVLLNNAPVPFVHMADDIAGVVQHYERDAESGALRVVERRGWVTIVPPPRAQSMPSPWIFTAPWNQQN